MTRTPRPRNIAFVGNRGCGKSSLINCCSTLTTTKRVTKRENSDEELEELPLIIDPIFLAKTQDEEAVPMVLIDTAAKNVVGTKKEMRQADLIAVVASINNEDDLDKALNYWLNNQLKAIRATQPICLIINKVDSISSEYHESIIEKWAELLNHGIWEKYFFVSSKTGSGVQNMLMWFSNILRDCILYPQTVLYDKWEDRLCANFSVAITRVFRALDTEDKGVLSFEENVFLNNDVLKSDFSKKGFNHCLQKLNMERDSYVTQQGITLEGFFFLMLQRARQRKWKDCWTILRHFNYNDDLKLKPRWTLPLELEADQVIKLLPKAFHFLKKLFLCYSEEKNGILVISKYAIANIFNVLPEKESISLLSLSQKFSMFETDNVSDSPSLTLNGWLSCWAIAANENATLMLRHLDYLISTSKPSTSGEWFRICKPKSAERESKHSERNVIRAMILSDVNVGKSTLCRQLIRSPNVSRETEEGPTRTGFQYYCNRVHNISESEVIWNNEYCFLCLTEVESNNQSVVYAMEKFIPKYDLVILAYDLSKKESIDVMVSLLDVVMKYNSAKLPVQVLALKHDLARDDIQVIAVKEKLKQLGLHDQQVVSATHQDLTELFKGLVELGQMPAAGRVRPRPATGISTYVKRTMSVSMLFLIVYGLYRVYQRQSGADQGSYTVSTANPISINPTALKQAAALGVVGSLNSKQGKQL